MEKITSYHFACINLPFLKRQNQYFCAIADEDNCAIWRHIFFSASCKYLIIGINNAGVNKLTQHAIRYSIPVNKNPPEVRFLTKRFK